MPYLLWLYGGLAALGVIVGAFVLASSLAALLTGDDLDGLALVSAILLCAYGGVVAYGILNEKPFVRILLGVLGGLAIIWSLVDLVRGAPLRAVALDLGLGALTIWYLFFKANVVEYFRDLKADSQKTGDD